MQRKISNLLFFGFTIHSRTRTIRLGSSLSFFSSSLFSSSSLSFFLEPRKKKTSTLLERRKFSTSVWKRREEEIEMRGKSQRAKKGARDEEERKGNERQDEKEKEKEKEEKEWKILIEKEDIKSELNLELTLRCGQVFRWKNSLELLSSSSPSLSSSEKKRKRGSVEKEEEIEGDLEKEKEKEKEKEIEWWGVVGKSVYCLKEREEREIVFRRVYPSVLSSQQVFFFLSFFLSFFLFFLFFLFLFFQQNRFQTKTSCGIIFNSITLFLICMQNGELALLFLNLPLHLPLHLLLLLLLPLPHLPLCLLSLQTKPSNKLVKISKDCVSFAKTQPNVSSLLFVLRIIILKELVQ